MGLSCIIFKIPVNFSLSLERKRGIGNPHKWHRKFRYKQEKRNTSEGTSFYPKNFLRDELFHLNSHPNYRISHTNGKHPGISEPFHSLLAIQQACVFFLFFSYGSNNKHIHATTACEKMVI